MGAAPDKDSVSGSLKNIFNLVADLNYKDAFSIFSQLWSNALGWFLLGYAVVSLRGLLRNKNLKPTQKILPFIGHGLFFVTRAALAIVAFIGATALVPFFLCAASIVGTYRNFMSYYKERKERTNLRMELMSEKNLLNKLAKIKNDEERKHIINYAIKSDKIFEKLYSLRKKIITSSEIPYSKKAELVAKFNDQIVKLSKNEVSKITVDHSINQYEWLMAEAKEINKEIDIYQEACQQYKKIRLSGSLKENIEYYKLTHNKIFAQDLPISIKNELLKILDGGKLTKNTLSQFYASMGNHYLNLTPHSQMKSSDEQFHKLLQDQYPQQASIIYDFINTPRQAYSIYQQLISELKNKNINIEDFKFSMTRFNNNPSDEKCCQDLLEKIERLENNVRLSADEVMYLSQLKSKIQLNKKLASDFSQLAIDSSEKLRIRTFQVSNLNQFINLYHQDEFPSPPIKFNLNEGDLLIELGITPTVDAISNKFLQGINKIKQQQNKATKNLTKHIMGAEKYNKIVKEEAWRDTTSAQRKFFASDFEKRFENSFSLVFKKERLNFVEYSVPRRLVNASLTAATAGITLLASGAVVFPFVFPTAVLTNIGIALSAFVMISGLYMYRKQEKGTEKIRKVIGSVKGATGPDFEISKKNKKQIKKIQKELAGNLGSQTTPEKKSLKKHWYSPLFTLSQKVSGHKTSVEKQQETDNAHKINKNKSF